jgi:biotin synthase
MPFADLIFKAQQIHRQHFAPNAVQLSTLLSIKTGGCPEDCGYCPQAARYHTGVENEALMSVEAVVEAARAARQNGASRFCMGAAWRGPKQRDLEKVAEMVREVKALGLETCATLGMLREGQAGVLKAAGLDYYNHNIDTDPVLYGDIITTREQGERFDTLHKVRQAGIHVCCGGIVGMEKPVQIARHSLPNSPSRSVSGKRPINNLVQVKGTPLHGTPELDSFEFVRTIAAARITMPRAMVRLSRGAKPCRTKCRRCAFWRAPIRSSMARNCSLRQSRGGSRSIAVRPARHRADGLPPGNYWRPITFRSFVR